MKQNIKNTLFIVLFLGANSFFAQQTTTILEVKIQKLEQQVSLLQQDIKKISLELDKDYWTYRGVKKETQLKLASQEQTIDSLNALIESNSQNIVANSSEFKTKIQQTGENANSKISELDNSLDKNRLYWIIATLLIFLLGGIIYWLLGKRIQSSKTDVEAQIKSTKKSLEEESVKLDIKLVEVLTKQLDLIKEDQTSNTSNKEDDHSLVLKVADRLTAMETNHYRMDPKTKGLKQLIKAVKSIKENYLASGYEIVEMLGQEYKEGMNVTANFIPSEKIETGKREITRIIKPQVNYNGKMIQAAQIEVSVGE